LRDNAEPGRRPAAVDDPVEAVRRDVGRCRLALELVQAAFLPHLVEFGCADVEAAGRHVERRHQRLDPVDACIDGGRGLDVVLDALDRRPGAGETRQREAVQPVLDQFLDARRVEDRHHGVDEGKLGRVRVGR
jgi:hypothetical protein